MRRVWATLLVVVFSFALIGPDALSSAERNLPACCRSNGKHHCASAQPQTGSSGPAFQAGRCRLFGGDLATPLPPAAIAMPSPAVFGAHFSHPTPRPQTEALGRLAFDRAAQKRGPPFLS
jgi:hypothetical protein